MPRVYLRMIPMTCKFDLGAFIVSVLLPYSLIRSAFSFAFNTRTENFSSYLTFLFRQVWLKYISSFVRWRLQWMLPQRIHWSSLFDLGAFIVSVLLPYSLIRSAFSFAFNTRTENFSSYLTFLFRQVWLKYISSFVRWRLQWMLPQRIHWSSLMNLEKELPRLL